MSFEASLICLGTDHADSQQALKTKLQKNARGKGKVSFMMQKSTFW